MCEAVLSFGMSGHRVCRCLDLAAGKFWVNSTFLHQNADECYLATPQFTDGGLHDVDFSSDLDVLRILGRRQSGANRGH